MIIQSIKNARYITEDGWIDMTLVTDEGDIPFTYSPDDDAQASRWIRDNLSGLTIAPYVPPPPPTLEELKAEKLRELAADRWTEMEQPTTLQGFGDALFDPKKEVVNDMLRVTDNLKAAIALGHMPPDTVIHYKIGDGSFLPMTLDDLITVRLLLAQRELGLYAKEKGLADMVGSAATAEEVAAVRWAA